MPTTEEKIIVKADLTELDKLKSAYNKAQNALNKMYAEGKKGTAQYAQQAAAVKRARVEYQNMNREMKGLGERTKLLTTANLRMAASFLGIGVGIQGIVRVIGESIRKYQQEELAGPHGE